MGKCGGGKKGPYGRDTECILIHVDIIQGQQKTMKGFQARGSDAIIFAIAEPLKEMKPLPLHAENEVV